MIAEKQKSERLLHETALTVFRIGSFGFVDRRSPAFCFLLPASRFLPPATCLLRLAKPLAKTRSTPSRTRPFKIRRLLSYCFAGITSLECGDPLPQRGCRAGDPGRRRFGLRRPGAASTVTKLDSNNERRQA